MIGRNGLLTFDAMADEVFPLTLLGELRREHQAMLEEMHRQRVLLGPLARTAIEAEEDV